MKNYKLALKIFLSVTCFIFLFSSAAIWYYDPLQIFHKLFSKKITYGSDTREDLKAFIRDQDFNNFIVGTCYATSMSAKEAGEKLGGKWFNLSSFETSPFGAGLVANYTIKQKKKKNQKIDNIIILTELYIIDNKKKTMDKWGFLYDDDPYNDIKIYLNYKHLRCVF